MRALMMMTLALLFATTTPLVWAQDDGSSSDEDSFSSDEESFSSDEESFSSDEDSFSSDEYSNDDVDAAGDEESDATGDELVDETEAANDEASAPGNPVTEGAPASAEPVKDVSVVPGEAEFWKLSKEEQLKLAENINNLSEEDRQKLIEYFSKLPIGGSEEERLEHEKLMREMTGATGIIINII